MLAFEILQNGVQRAHIYDISDNKYTEKELA